MAGPGNLSRRGLWMQRLADEVVRGLTARICSGALPAGAPLPGREALTAEFVTSDGVVERALEKLAAEGLVVADAEGVLRVAGLPTPETAFDIPDSEAATIADVIAVVELRIGVETEAASLAAQRRTDADLAAIRAAAEHFEAAAAAGNAPAQADFQFHRAICEATGNAYFRDLTEFLGPLLIPRMRIALSSRGGGGVDVNLQKSVTEHGVIVDAIAQSDPEAARAAMRRHLTRTLDLMRTLDPAP